MYRKIFKAVIVSAVAAFAIAGCDNDLGTDDKGDIQDLLDDLRGITHTYTLTTNVSPSSGGYVSRNPSKSSYTSGESVTVTASAYSGYTFTGWSGASSSSYSSVTISMTESKTLTANFQQQSQQQSSYTLTTNVNPSSGGYVSRSPNKTYYTYGESVTVTASAYSGYTFTGWSGASSSTSSSVTIYMYGSTTLTANFQQISSGGGGGGSLSGSGVAWMSGNCSSTCSGYLFRSNGTIGIISYYPAGGTCNVSDALSGYTWSTNGNKLYLGYPGTTTTFEYGTISGNTLTISGSAFTRTTGIPCAY